MITLKANAELKQTFEKLIQTMNVPVKWNGLFVVIQNYILLQGEVRSLFFRFEDRKVITNIIDLTIGEDAVKEIGDNIWVRNVINMLLYAFGKWGGIQGLKVEQNYVELNQLFTEILKEINLECEYSNEHFYFYQKGMRITYEDVIQAALEAKEKEPEIEGEEQGLWHKLLWKKELLSFPIVETILAERQKNRIGDNFYMVGYLCPDCRKNLHMVVYPVGKEFTIETEEGQVLLARVCTCQDCCKFYTPRPKKLLAEGDIYVMDFEKDKKAYEDYKSLLGKNGDRVSNHNFNRFVKETEEDSLSEPEKEREDTDVEENGINLDWISQRLPEMEDWEFGRLTKMIEDGFYPDESVERMEAAVAEQKEIRKKRREEWVRGKDDLLEKSAQDIEKHVHTQREKKVGTTIRSGKQQSSEPEEPERDLVSTSKKNGIQTEKAENRNEDVTENQKVYSAETEEKYKTRVGQYKRLSERQRRELKIQLKEEKNVSEAVKNGLFAEMNREEQEENLQKYKEKTSQLKDKNYVVLQRLYDEVKEADLPETEKEQLLESLKEQKKEQAKQEVEALMEKKPRHLDRRGCQTYLEKIRSYKDVDTTPYEEQFQSMKKEAEEQEIASMVRHSRVGTRDDLQNLLERLKGQDFSIDVLKPYEEKINSKIRMLDEEAIGEICKNPMEMTFEEAVEAYEQIENGPFLPELKADALKMLTKRLSKIKTDECELLVQKLKNELAEAQIPEIEEHHFYPARKVLMKQASKEETEVIDFARASYAAGIGTFEYPILVVDTSRNKSGDKGMILTPENLFYSNLTTSYHISVFSIEKVRAMTGMLNRGLYVYQKNGAKTKIPYAVDHKDLPKLAEVLDGFIHYLQEKPFSRKEVYLAKEKHETICCYRCGHVYVGGNICPKCGYQRNG